MKAIINGIELRLTITMTRKRYMKLVSSNMMDDVGSDDGVIEDGADRDRRR